MNPHRARYALAIAAALVAAPALTNPALAQQSPSAGPSVANPAATDPAPSTGTAPAMATAPSTGTAPAMAVAPGTATTPGMATTGAPGLVSADAPMSRDGAGTRERSTYMTVDQHVRASKVIGASVYNDQDQKVGTVEDLLLSQSRDVTGVVLSVGGFLGIDARYVEVPFSRLQVTTDKVIMPGASSDALKQMPVYRFNQPS